jgi:hypothetical protein
MSKHGGSPESGLVLPIGTDTAKLAPGAQFVLEPAVAEEIRQRAARKMNFERRRIALELLPTVIPMVEQGTALASDGALAYLRVEAALSLADALIEQTGGEL